MEGNKKLKNGLTAENVKDARDILSCVNIAEICREVGVNRSTINHVLAGKSKKVDDLVRVLQVAEGRVQTSRNFFKAIQTTL